MHIKPVKLRLSCTETILKFNFFLKNNVLIIIKFNLLRSTKINTEKRESL